MKGIHLVRVVGVVLSLVSICLGENFRWGNVEIGGGGFVSAVLPSPIERDVIYARTDVGGAYRWDEENQRWIALTDWVSVDERGLLGIEGMAVDPTTPGTVYMMAGTVYWNQANDGIGRSAFLRSKDYGNTWEKIYTWDNTTKWFNVHGNGMGRGNGERLAVDPANSQILFYGTRNKGLWKSTNNGTTWNKVTSFPVDTTWNGAGISFVQFDASTRGATGTNRIYVGVLREGSNLFVSENGGNTWAAVPGRPTLEFGERLMPQRIALAADGSHAFITFGNGAGPHTMQWDEGWGPINDWFNRGAVFKYTRSGNSWTNVSPQNLVNPANDGTPSDPAQYYGCYSGVSIDPNNPNLVVVSSIASYRGPQFWRINGSWTDRWGDNIFVSTDGGQTWAASFQYYWLDGGMSPTVEQMDAGGYPWIVGNTIHWIGSVAIDPFRPQRVFVTSGNGVFLTDNILNYSFGDPDWSNTRPLTQRTVWKFAGAGIEETVPEDLVSIPGGPLVSVILDYDGFVHYDVSQPAPLGRHSTMVSGTSAHLGSTTGLAYAPKTGRLAKVARTREVALQYNTIPIGPVQYSNDTGKTWTVETYTDNPPTGLHGGKLALSADGAVTLWMPQQGTTMYRHNNSAWTTVTGINFWGRPFADPINDNTFYVFNRTEGNLYVSTDKGVTFTRRGSPGISNFGTGRATPDRQGHLWIPIARVSESGERSGSLMRSTDGGTSFTAVASVGYCEAVGFGRAAPGASYPAIYIYASVNGQVGVFQSINEGLTWVRVNDDQHQYGGLANGEFVMGDMNTFGVVYMSTAGRGIAARLPSDASVPAKLDDKKSTPYQGKALLRNHQLFLQTSEMPLRVYLHDLQGKLLWNATYFNRTQVDLLPIMANIPAKAPILSVWQGRQKLLVNHLLRNTAVTNP